MTIAALPKHAGKLILGGLAYYLGTIGGAGLAISLGLPAPALPEGVDQATLGLYALAAAPLVPLVLAPLSRRLPVRFVVRWLVLAGLAWVALGINTALEAAVFSPAQAAIGFSAWAYGVAGLACAAVVAWLYPPAGAPVAVGASVRSFVAGRRPTRWAVRGVLALAAFPVVYLVFGMAVRPVIEGYYVEAGLGLRIPGWGELLSVLLVRSAFFLAACGPLIAFWRGSSRRLWLTLGAALFVLVGGVQMIQSYWFPTTMRVVHGLEILADSFVYAGLLTVLLRGGGATGATLASEPAEGAGRRTSRIALP